MTNKYKLDRLGSLTISNISYELAQKICDAEFGSIMWMNGKAYPANDTVCNWQDNVELEAAPPADVEPVGELRCDATTGHVYGVHWYERSAPAIGTKVFIEPPVKAYVEPISKSVMKRINVQEGRDVLDVEPAFYVSKRSYDLAMTSASGIGVKGISREKLLPDDVACYTQPPIDYITTYATDADRWNAFFNLSAMCTELKVIQNQEGGISIIPVEFVDNITFKDLHGDTLDDAIDKCRGINEPISM